MSIKKQFWEQVCVTINCASCITSRRTMRCSSLRLSSWTSVQQAATLNMPFCAINFSLIGPSLPVNNKNNPVGWGAFNSTAGLNVGAFPSSRSRRPLNPARVGALPYNATVQEHICSVYAVGILKDPSILSNFYSRCRLKTVKKDAVDYCAAIFRCGVFHGFQSTWPTVSPAVTLWAAK